MNSTNRNWVAEKSLGDSVVKLSVPMDSSYLDTVSCHFLPHDLG